MSRAELEKRILRLYKGGTGLVKIGKTLGIGKGTSRNLVALFFVCNLTAPSDQRSSMLIATELLAVVLALQLHVSSEVSAASVGLVSSPPERPCENTVDRDAPLSELDSDATDFLDRPAESRTLFGCLLYTSDAADE